LAHGRDYFRVVSCIHLGFVFAGQFLQPLAGERIADMAGQTAGTGRLAL
jgi:hypothetical protein